ncbi:triose-phosphate transporter family protein [Nitzschia inconspicua]|uniref:Triose-phosphate transporter family protein n=1 Tax=Nitzschia inconspicua TaxID=303405 RepID=A0A9K3LMF8_9STRA|nr:triose-phosphate transporter family protein [Nitzschia inconspicua]KAG7363471.1 triose-phosphate transporter family protein [Nitzschia inconspicua]
MGDAGYIASVVATYWFVSISMVYLNKILMSNDDVSIPAPLFITWYQCVVTILVCWVAGKVGEVMLKRGEVLPTNESDGFNANKGHRGKSFFSQFPKAQYNVSVGRKVLPLSIIFVGMISFNNLCLQYVEVSFYNVARSLTIVFNVVLSRIILGSPSSIKTLLCLSIVILGFFMGAKGEVNFTMIGTLFGICSSLFVSLNSILTKKVLPAVDNDHWKLTFYNNVNAMILFLPLIAYFESGPILAGFRKQFISPTFWAAMSVAGIMGFSIGIVTVLQIKATSPLSHNISGTAKAAFQSMLAFYIWKNPATVMGVAGMFVVLGGSLLYTIVKMREGSTTGKKPIPTSSPKQNASA